MPLAFERFVLFHQPLSIATPARKVCRFPMVKSTFCSIWNCLARRVPDCPAPPLVKASSTRTAGRSEAGVVSLCWLDHSTFSSLNTLPMRRAWSTRSVSAPLSTAKARVGRSKSPTPRLSRELLRRAYSARTWLLSLIWWTMRMLVLRPSVGCRTWPKTSPVGDAATIVRDV